MKQTLSSNLATDLECRPEWSFWLSLKNLLDDAVKDWRLPRGMILAIVAIPFIVAFSGIVAALFGKESYKWFTGEDGIAETLQVIFYCLSLILSLMVLCHQRRAGNRLIVLLYVCLSCGLLFLVGEELSWGQRIIGWMTPEALQSINKQGETNLHNIHGVGQTFKWMQLLVGAYGTVLPILLLQYTAFALPKRLISATVPHYSLVPYFLLLFIWRIFRNAVDVPERYYFVVSEYNEVMELVLSMGFLLFLIYQLRRLKDQVPENF